MGGTEAARLADTQRAFDSVAADYDGPRGNNALIQRMRRTLWDVVDREAAPGSRLLDLGCGTGLDAHRFAQAGHPVVATDWSPAMVARTRERLAAAALAVPAEARQLGIHELDRLDASFDGTFGGIYSNFGPMNCVPDLSAAAAQCARLLQPGGVLVFSVMGRICPWELGHYAVRGRFRRAGIRAARGMTAVGMNRHTIWTRYYLPREFHRPFAARFSLEGYRALSLFLPPPYLVDVCERRPRLGERLGRLDDRVGGWPLLRGMGDHFLMVMRKR
ncbi:MAG: class I SAM-dependent methyltransferase [Luteimonas sp.]